MAREETVTREVLVLARPYSLLRYAGMKWTSPEEVEGKVCEQVKTEGGTVIVLFIGKLGDPLFRVLRPHSAAECYSVSDLTQRLSLKRSPDLFRCLYTVWTHVNPARGKAISKEVYLKLTETFAASLSLPFSTHFSLQDMHIDFRHLRTLLFKDFYDSFFQLIDCSLASKVPSHYAKQATIACSGLLNARWYRQLTAGRTEEGRDKRKAFEGWMLPFFHSPSVHTSQGSRAGVSFEAKKPVHPKKRANSTVRSRPASRLSPASTEYSLLRIHSLCPSPRHL